MYRLPMELGPEDVSQLKCLIVQSKTDMHTEVNQMMVHIQCIYISFLTFTSFPEEYAQSNLVPVESHTMATTLCLSFS